MNAKTTRLDWHERRQRRAWEFKQQGWRQQDIAATLGATPGAVSQWLKRGREHGMAGLQHHPASGLIPKLNAAQLAQIPAWLERGAEAYGFRGQVWTCQASCRVHPPHLWRQLPSRLRQSTAAHAATERPAPSLVRRAAQRSSYCRLVARAVAGPGKKATEDGRIIVWVGQSGFYLRPMAVRTRTQWGRTPTLTAPLTHDRLAAHHLSSIPRIVLITPMSDWEERVPLVEMDAHERPILAAAHSEPDHATGQAATRRMPASRQR